MRTLIFKRIAVTLLFLLLTGARMTFAMLPTKGLSRQTPADGTTQSGGAEELNRLNESVLKLYSKGKFKEALPLAKRALELAEKAFGVESRELAPLLANLAESHIGLKQYAEAEPIARRSLVILEKALGPDHPDLNKALHRLALLRHLAGDDAEAEALYQRAVAISERTFGAEHIEVARSLEKLALLYGDQRETEKTGKSYARLAEIVEKIPDSELSRTEEPLARYACLKSKLKQTTNLYQGFPAPTDLFNGKAVILGQPKFPVEAQRSGAHGHVPVRVLIDEEGKVIQACAMGGPKVFEEAAEDAALHSSFTPVVVQGQPVKVKGIITFNFVANPRKR